MIPSASLLNAGKSAGYSFAQSIGRPGDVRLKPDATEATIRMNCSEGRGVVGTTVGNASIRSAAGL